MKTMLALSWHKRIWVCGLIAASAMATTSANAQSVAPRIRSEITSSEQATLKGSLHPQAQAQFDAGRVPAETRLNGVSIVFSRTAEQQADLKALIAAQQNPASPLYHQWLTPEQFAARFGMAESDLTRVEGWLEQQGFSVDSVARSRNLIRFSGTSRQIEQAFSTEMHYYKAAGVQHFAPSTDLSIPAALAPVVLAVRNLSDFRPKPQVVLRKNVRARPGFTSSQSTSVFFAPGDIKTVYNFPTSGSGYTGSGQTIVIVGQSAISTTDIENFQNAAGLTVKDPTLTLVPGTGTSEVNPGNANAGDELESDLDIEWSGAIATGASIDFVYTGSNTNYGVFDALQYAIDNKIGAIVSASYGDCETDLGSANAAALELILAQGVSQGQSIVSAAGDSGSTACYGYTNLTPTQQDALAVNYPASSAYVTGVGGTAISLANSAYEKQGDGYWAAQGNSDIISSALQYIPEVVWNDDASAEASSVPGLSAGGGGASAFFTKPSWQTGVTGIPSGNARYVPDVSLYSSPDNPGYLYCSSDVSTTITGSCSNGFRDANNQYLTVAGGTSFAAPIFAGMVAILNQKAGYTTGQGLVNTELYKLASNPTTYASAFHDITSGSNACTGGSSFCSTSGESGFSAATGYDEATGLGSVNFDNLVSAWAANTMTATTTALSVSPSSAAVGVSVTLTATVTPSAAGGTVTFYDGATMLGTGTLSSGKATYTTSTLAVGPHSLTAAYTGDSAYSTSTSSAVTFVVSTSSGSTATTTMLSASTTTPSFGASVTFTATVAPSAATGTVYFYDGTTSLGTGTLNSGTATYSTSTLTAGAHTITATYGGDTTYASSSSSGFTVTVSSPTFTLSATNVTVAQGSQGNTTITVTPSGYTGTVDLTPTASTASFCYSTSTATVTGSSAVTTTMALDTNLADCGTAAAQKGHGMRIFRSTGAKASLTSHASPSIAAAAFSLAGLFFAGLLGWRRRQLRLLSCLIALGVIGFLFSGCGGGSSSSTNDTPTGTYTITLTGQDSTSTSIPSATTNFTLVVN
jgi:subtilase family serine protease